MSVSIFVEGPTDAALVGRLLADLEPKAQFRIIVAGDRNAARPLARLQLVTRHEPVILIIDSDTTDEESARAQQNDPNDYLAWGASTTPYKVVQFIPEIEVVFFDDPSVLRAIVGREVDPHIRAAGIQAPRRILEMLTQGRDRQRIIDALDDDEIETLRKQPIIADLREFLAPEFPVEASGSGG